MGKEGRVSELELYRDVLRGETSAAWEKLAPLVPEWMYLSGGTALAMHLHHRVSRDLDLFTERPFDAESQADLLTAAFDDFAATLVTTGTVNGVLGETKVQFLDASTQHRIVEPKLIAGIQVAGIEDILATKLKVVMDRGALRDYFDLMSIEQHTDLDVINGLALYIERYQPKAPDQHIGQIIRALGFFEDVDDDPALPVERGEIERYWRKRQPEVVRGLGLR
jgi:hypothetical protein